MKKLIYIKMEIHLGQMELVIKIIKELQLLFVMKIVIWDF